MAIPTDFKGFTPAAATTKTFKILGSATVGIWACDVDGTLSATSSWIPIAPNLILFMDQVYTDAAIVVALQDFIKRIGGQRDTGGAGGHRVETTKQVAFAGVTTA